MAKNFENKVSITVKGRIIFARIFAPEAPYGNEEGDPIYSFTLLIPKSDTQTITAINNAIKNAENNALANNSISKAQLTSQSYHNPLRDGNEKAEERKEYQDMYFLSVKRKRFFEADKVTERKAKLVVKTGNKQFRDATVKDIYNGCWVEAYLTFFTYNKGGVGTSVSYEAICKHHDDEPIGWTPQPEIIFDSSDATVYTEEEETDDYRF